jgi:hypothetical protein
MGLTLTNCNSTKGEIEMNTEQIMHMVYDYADAFHNRVDSIGEVDTPTQKELKHSQMEIGKQIKAAIEALVQERDALKAALTKAKAMPMKYRRMGFNAQLQHEANKLAAELKALRDSDVALPDHPEPQIMIWTQVELEAIRDYGNRRAMAERERCAGYAERLAKDFGSARMKEEWEVATDISKAIRKGE